MNVCKDNCLAECIQCEPMKLKQVHEWLVEASGEMYPFPWEGVSIDHSSRIHQ